MRSPTPPRTPSRTVTLHELPALPDQDRVVFVTNAVRRRGGLRARAEQPRGPVRPVGPVLAAVVR